MGLSVLSMTLMTRELWLNPATEQEEEREQELVLNGVTEVMSILGGMSMYVYFFDEASCQSASVLTGWASADGALGLDVQLEDGHIKTTPGTNPDNDVVWKDWSVRLDPEFVETMSKVFNKQEDGR